MFDYDYDETYEYDYDADDYGDGDWGSQHGYYYSNFDNEPAPLGYLLRVSVRRHVDQVRRFILRVTSRVRRCEDCGKRGCMYDTRWCKDHWLPF